MVEIRQQHLITLAPELLLVVLVHGAYSDRGGSTGDWAVNLHTSPQGILPLGVVSEKRTGRLLLCGYFPGMCIQKQKIPPPGKNRGR